MRTDRSRLAIWCCLLLVVLTASGCFSDPPKPDKRATERPDWTSVETTSEADVVIERVAYQSGDLTINGQVCRPSGDGPYPVLIWNHGGYGGLPDWDDPKGFCALVAKSGWVMAESSYRGEDDSEGQLEVCRGEVDDVLAMLDVVRGQSYADSERVAMVGQSHGGCITSKAVERGADIDVAADISGPTDWGALVTDVKQAQNRPSADPTLQKVLEDTVDVVEKAVGGSPSQYPERYAETSPDAEKIARSDTPFIIMHGVADTIVPVRQSCDLASKAGDFKAYRFDIAGAVVPEAPSGCEELTWNDAPSPTDTFNADRYLFVYDKVDHFLVANNGLTRMMQDFFRLFEAKAPAA